MSAARARDRPAAGRHGTSDAPRPRIGTHMSTGGRLASVPHRAADMGAEAIQIFAGNPRGWATPAGDPSVDAAFRQGAGKHRLTVMVHAA